MIGTYVLVLVSEGRRIEGQLSARANTTGVGDRKSRVGWKVVLEFIEAHSH